MTEIWTLYSTFARRDEALSAARTLLSERLVACANVTSPVTSVYRWEGKLQQEEEVALVAKTSADKVDAATARLKELHPYQLPCIVAWPLEKGHAPFFDWVANETSGKKLD